MGMCIFRQIDALPVAIRYQSFRTLDPKIYSVLNYRMSVSIEYHRSLYACLNRFVQTIINANNTGISAVFFYHSFSETFTEP